MWCIAICVIYCAYVGVFVGGPANLISSAISADLGKQVAICLCFTIYCMIGTVFKLDGFYGLFYANSNSFTIYVIDNTE